MVRDSWLDALRGRAEFTDLLRKAHHCTREASTAFSPGGGPTLLGIRTEATRPGLFLKGNCNCDSAPFPSRVASFRACVKASDYS